MNQTTVSYTRTFGDAPCDNCQVPAMGTDDGTNLPGNGFIGLFRQNNYEWKDIATLTHGRHSFKFGGEVVRQPWTNTQITETLTFNTRQTGDLNSLGNTGNALASYLMGLMDTTELSQADFTLESQTINFYVQDSWKLTNTLPSTSDCVGTSPGRRISRATSPL